MSSTLKSVIQYAVIALIGVLFLYFVFNGMDWNDLLEKFKHTNYTWIAAGMAISLFSHYLRAYRALMLYDVLDYKVSVRNSAYAVMIGYMMNYIIPRAGEVSRCAALNKTNDIPVNKSLGTVVTERVFDMVILLVILGLVFVLQFDLLMNYLNQALGTKSDKQSSSILIWIFLAAIVIVSAAFFLLRNKIKNTGFYIKIANVIKGFSEGLLSIRYVKKPFLFVLLSVSIWVSYLLMMYFCFFAMQATANLNFSACLTVFAIGTIGVVVPAPGAGAGTYHFAVMQSLLLFGVPAEDGIAYATIVHGVQMVLLLLVGALCSLAVLSMQKRKSSNHVAL